VGGKVLRVFILEDDDNRIIKFRQNFINAKLTFAKKSKDAIKILQKQSPFDYIFLDHDLGGDQIVKSGENTGYEVAKWLSENKIKKPKYGLFVHSLNKPGADNMIGKLGYGTYVPFAWMKVIKF
jgi:CheY-like chemotaxis protein